MNPKPLILLTLVFFAACAPLASGSDTPEATAIGQVEPTVSTPTATVQPTLSPSSSPTAAPTLHPTNTAVLPTEIPATETPTLTPTPAKPFADFELMLAPGSQNWESAFIDPGAVIYHDGQFHMFYNGISGWPAHVKVGYATSEDGINWTRMSDEPVFTGEGLDYSGVSIFTSSAAVLEDGTWVLYFYTIDTGNFSGPGKIGLATADSPYGPFVAADAPVLLTGPEGSWDEHAVMHPNVIPVDDGYVMYYDGNRGDSQEERDRKIGMATSPDGLVWTKYDIPSTTADVVAESDPIFKTGGFGDWDRDRVMDPNVFKTENGWVMIYGSNHFDVDKQRRDYRLGIAISEDGVNWNKPEDNQILSTLADKGWNAIYLVTAVHVDNTTYLYFDVQSTVTSGTAIYGALHEGELSMP